MDMTYRMNREKAHRSLVWKPQATREIGFKVRKEEHY